MTLLTGPSPPLEQQPPSSGPGAGEWSLFVDWCAATGRCPLPASTEVLLEFFIDCPAAPATLTKRARAVDAAARAAGYQPVVRTADFRDVLRGRPAQPVRQTVTREQVDAALRALPTSGWTQGWFGRRDRALLVLAHVAGLPYRRIARLTAGDPTFTPDGTVQVTALNGVVIVAPAGDPTACGPCALAHWIQALDREVTFQRVADFLRNAGRISSQSPHMCTTAVTADPATLATALFPPADQWGSTAIEPEPMRPRSLSQLARDHGAGRHPPHRIIGHSPLPVPQPQLPEPAAEPTAVAAPYSVAGWRAGVNRRNADRERLAHLDILLDDLDEKARELERRTRQLLDSGQDQRPPARGGPAP